MPNFLLQCKKEGMKTIGEQINIFLAEAGIPASTLASVSGVHNVYISRLRNGRQKDTFAQKADALRSAMLKLDPAAAAKALAQ